MSDAPRIVHEAEVQRQHPRFRIPAQCLINGAAYEVFDWSLGGLAILGFEDALAIGDLLDLQIVYQIDQVALVVDVIGEVRYQRVQEHRVGFRFSNIGETQQSMMRRVFESYLEGEILPYESVVNGIDLGSAQAANITKTRITPSRFMGLSALAALSLGLAWTVSSNIYARSFVHRAAAAVVEAEGFPVNAPVSGQLNFISQKKDVVDGEVVASVRDRNGTDVMIDSPCACRAKLIGATGGFVTRGDSLMRLIPPNATIRLRVTLPRSALANIDQATIGVTYSDGVKLIRPAIELKPRIIFETGDAKPTGGELFADVHFETGRSDLHPDQDQMPVKVVIDSSPVSPMAVSIGFGS
jgi:mannuronan synthase